MTTRPARHVSTRAGDLAHAGSHVAPFLDAGALAVLVLTTVLFVAPMVTWALLSARTSADVPAGFEVRALLWGVLLSLLLPLLQIYLQIKQLGGAAIRGNRVGFPPFDGAAGRVARGHKNLIESLVPFATAVLAAQTLGVSTRWTVAACGMYFAARLVHAVTYAVGIMVLRSAAFYAGVVATVVVVVQLPL